MPPRRHQDKARRSLRAVLLAGAMLLIAVTGTACGTASNAPAASAGPPPLVGTGDGQATAMRSTPLIPVSSSPTSTSIDWSSDQTSVIDNGAIAFVTPLIGWRLVGQEMGLDQNLSAPGGPALYWPGQAVQVTADSGRSWRTVLDLPAGAWQVDPISAQSGYVIGVTSLESTTDGGAHWQAVPEPAGHSLVWAHFTSLAQGVGLTSAGNLVSTDASGQLWQEIPLPHPATATCFVDSGHGYVADASGDLYQIDKAAKQPLISLIQPGPTHVEQYVGPFSEISCSNTRVVVASINVCGATCGANPEAFYLRSNARRRAGLERLDVSS